MVKRCFLALPVPGEPLAALLATAAELRRAAVGRVRWVEPAQMHLTLLFLGEQPDDVVDRLVEELPSLPLAFPIPLRLDGLGSFGGNRPRVVWAGLTGQIEALREVQLHLAHWVRSHGIDLTAERYPFRPHITLGRVHRAAACLQATLERTVVDSVAWFADRCVLFESLQTESTPVYARLAESRNA